MGVVLLAAFVVVEARSTYPLLPLRVVLERNRGGSYLATLLNIVGLFAMFIFLSYYMQQILHYSAAKAGVAFLPFALGVIVAAGVATPLCPRSGLASRSPSAFFAAVGLLWLTQIGVHTSYWTHLFPQQIVMSLGLGLAFPALSSTALTKCVSETPAWPSADGEYHAAGRCFPGRGPLNTIAATATASYIASHGPRLAERRRTRVYRGICRGAAILAAGAIASAVLVNAKAKDLSIPDASPAVANAWMSEEALFQTSEILGEASSSARMTRLQSSTSGMSRYPTLENER